MALRNLQFLLLANLLVLWSVAAYRWRASDASRRPMGSMSTYDLLMGYLPLPLKLWLVLSSVSGVIALYCLRRS